MAGTEHVAHQSEAEEQIASSQRGQSTAALEVPEWPALAPNVQLVGELRGTGFTDQQWLIQRDGRFIQLTELLYRIAEQANGKRTLEEIATGVTESTDWMVSAEAVRHLIQTKLVPLGLVAGADGPPASCQAATAADRARSPLAVNMRVKAVSPRIIDPITKALQVLYSPAVFFSLLIAATIAHWWLYRVHGIAESLHDVLYTPGGLLLVLVFIVLAGMFHELGHASALRYGGGKVRGMGVGLYLIYPVLYTDVTDSYRLGRWARLRTDFGGIYFHLIFALGLILFSAATGRELLLFAVLLINLQVIGQFIPFVRFDGYWILADLTGIPDFFSQMGPFLRSVLPVPGLKGSRLPNLKPWVKAVFAFYIVGTVPLLAYLLFLTVRRLPSFLVRSWDAFLIQTRLFSLAKSQGDYPIMALLITQMLLLALPVVGTLYVLYRVSRAPIRGIWSWSKPTTTRQLAGVLAYCVIVTLLWIWWAPQWRELTGNRAAAAQAEAKIKRTREVTARHQSLQADLEGSLGPDRFTGTIILKRPNLARVDIKGEGDLGEFLIVSDGSDLSVYFPGDNRYAQSDPGAAGSNIQGLLVVEQVDHFFRPDAIGVAPAGGRSILIGKEQIDGAEYDVVDVEGPASQNKTTRYWISTDDHLIHRVVTTTRSKGGKTGSTWASLKNVRIDAPTDESTFRWSPPPSAGPLRLPSGIVLPGSRPL